MRVANNATGRDPRLGVLEHVYGSDMALDRTERELKRMLETRGIRFGEGLLPTCADGFVAPAEQIARWAARAERFVGTMESLANELVSDDAFCSSLGLDDEALDLLRIDHGYTRTCVLCRPDGIPVAG